MKKAYKIPRCFILNPLKNLKNCIQIFSEAYTTEEVKLFTLGSDMGSIEKTTFVPVFMVWVVWDQHPTTTHALAPPPPTTDTHPHLTMSQSNHPSVA